MKLLSNQSIAVPSRGRASHKATFAQALAAGLIGLLGPQSVSAETPAGIPLAVARAVASPDQPQSAQRDEVRSATPAANVQLARETLRGNTKATSQSAVAAPAPAVPAPPPPLIAVISIADQTIDVFGQEGSSIARSRVSTGKAGHSTPTGVFSILQRNRYHESNIYSNAPMPFMQRLTWSGIALHQGHVPNYRASHGCIRLPGAFASQLWGMGRLGMRVIVSPTRTSPAAFQHAALPNPLAQTITRTASRVQVANIGTDTLGTSTAMVLSPFEAAHARLAQATADKQAADRAVKPALDRARSTSAEAEQIAAAMKASAAILADAEADLEHERFGLATVQTEAAEAVILERLRVAEAGWTAAREAHEKLARREREAFDAAMAAAVAAREAQDAIGGAEIALRSARKGIQPISVFVSRATGQVYVRQGYDELHGGPLAIAEPDRPLGTHVYTAVASPDGKPGVRWLAVTVPTNGGEAARSARGATSDAQPSNAADALARVDLPAEVRTLVSERLWPGGSLIISDFGLGETNVGTDFVILTR